MRQAGEGMADQTPGPNTPDDGLKRIMTWTFVALAAALVLAAVGVYLVTALFGSD